MPDLVRIWYVSPQRLCNFGCTYCVSTGDWAKSSTVNWQQDSDLAGFQAIVRWIGARPFPVGVRLASLGEPFTSPEFLEQAGWLTRQEPVRFVELLTNGSLLKSRLPRLADRADLSRLSLWATYHDTEMPLERFMANVTFAQREFGCFVVVNALLFPGNVEQVRRVRAAAAEAGLRFNLDVGYDPDDDVGTYAQAETVVPLTQQPDWQRQAVGLGIRPEVLATNLVALNDVHGRPCSAGFDYLFIGIDGEVYPCSRYYELGHQRLGNVLDDDFTFEPRASRWAACSAPHGCSNKEDFLNLELGSTLRASGAPSLGWTGE